MNWKEVIEVNSFKKIFLTYLAIGNICVILMWKFGGVMFDTVGLEFLILPFSIIIFFLSYFLLLKINLGFILVLTIFTILLVILFDLLRKRIKKRFMVVYIILHLIFAFISWFLSLAIY